MRRAFMQRSETQKKIGTGKAGKNIWCNIILTTIPIRKKEVRCSSPSAR